MTRTSVILNIRLPRAREAGDIEVFRTFDDASARNAEKALKSAGIHYRLTHSSEGSKGQFKMVEFHVAPQYRVLAHSIIDEEVNM